MKPIRRTISVLASVAISIGIAADAMAQSYPAKPVHLLVGFPAGGPADIGARLVAQWLGERLGQQVIGAAAGRRGDKLGPDLEDREATRPLHWAGRPSGVGALVQLGQGER